MLGDELVGHQEVLEGLWGAAAARRLPHALTFEGPSGVGKFLAAQRLAAGLLCDAGPGAPCGSCGPCRRVNAESHPDLFVLDPGEAEVLAIHYVTRRDPQPREVQPLDEFLSLRAAEGGWRVVIVRDFGRANDPAQNALLKILEEPGASTLIVLETAWPEGLLTTILSRCARIRFGGLEPQAAALVLERAGLELGRAKTLARWADGSPGRALELAQQEAELTRACIEAILEGTLEPFAFGAQLAEGGGEFRGKTEPAKARARAAAAVELSMAVIGDLARHAAGVPAERLAHGDLCGRFAAERSSSALFAALEALLQARQDVESNLDPGGVLDRAALSLAELNPTPPPRLASR